MRVRQDKEDQYEIGIVGISLERSKKELRDRIKVLILQADHSSVCLMPRKENVALVDSTTVVGHYRDSRPLETRF